MLPLGLVLAALIGAIVGLLGGGGAALGVPLFRYVFAQDAHTAIASALLMVAVTSAAAIVPHARAGRVQLGVAAWFGSASLVGAYAGGRVARHLPGELLLIGFALLMVVTAATMLWPRPATTAPSPARVAGWALAPIGLVVGAIAGLVGAGGGFLTVPVLTGLAGVDITVAIGTSVLITCATSLAGFAGAIAGVTLDRVLVAESIGCAVVGAVAGALGSGRVPRVRLRQAFGWLVLVIAVVVLAREL